MVKKISISLVLTEERNKKNVMFGWRVSRLKIGTGLPAESRNPIP